MHDLFQALRPQQWIKNLLCYAGCFFALRLSDPATFWRATTAFLVFCAVSSAVYILNDLLDRDSDRHHPFKSKRPIASGRISARMAIAVASLLILGGGAAAVRLGHYFSAIVAVYIAQNIAYSLALKKVAIVDIMCIALGFVWRAVAGVAAANVALSHWLLLCTFSVSMFLAVAKRRHELLTLEVNATRHRNVLSEYSVPFIDAVMMITTALTVFSYALYTVADETIGKFGTDRLIYTTPFVFYGVFHYLYLVYQRNEGGNPASLILHDRPLQINIALWIVVVGGLIY
ncbi:MAG TPA: decaprenyl-phosphate phosphoribosyltransferase [Bdellovibrionota bacterium]|nr:decaprenyl-phosphate phosphoribosyltransferase [Bdellovibrionota bacterium]